MRFVPVLTAALLGVFCAGVASAAEGTVALEGVKAEVRAPKGGWPMASEVPKGSTGGQWRVVFRGEKAQCEARVFPVQSAEEVKTVLWQAADKTSRQVQGSSFGRPSVRIFALDGHPAAESEFWVQSGTAHLEGRIRLLDDEETSRSQQPSTLGQRLAPALHVVEDAEDDDDVRTGVAQLDCARIAHHEPRATEPALLG